MTILRRAIWMAAKRAAADPRVQEKASEVVHEEIVPRVRTAVDAARPEIQRAKENVRRAGQGIRQSVSEHPSMRDAKDFLSGITKRPK
jgi:hypothetical protein